MKRILILGVLAVSLLLLACPGCTVKSSQGFDWPAWRGPAGDGISRESEWNPSALAGTPRVLWQQDVGRGYSSVAIQDNLLVTMGTKDGFCVVYGLEADTGRQKWRYSYENYFDTQATPVIEGDSVYALISEGALFCLNRKNGKLRWKKDLVADCGAVKPYFGFAGSPVVRGDLVILTANTAGIALDRRTGKVVWSSEPPAKQFEAADPTESNGTDYATPVVYEKNGRSFALLASCKGLSSVEVETGIPLWVYEWELYSGRQITDPVVIDDRIFIAVNFYPPNKNPPGSLLLDVAGAKPALLWKSQDLTTEISDAVVLDGYLYGGQGGPYRYGASLRCVDVRTGRLMWEQVMSDAASPNCVSLTAADGKLIVLSDDGILAVAEASPQAYKEISRCRVLPEVQPILQKFWTPPVLCNGRIYCRNFNAELVCIDVSR